jgi:hypothetical protein
MSYLLQYASRLREAPAPGPRLDERARLNHPGYFGEAYVLVRVGDTTGQPVIPRRRKRALLPAPEIVLEMADCANAINLEFALHDAGHRENSRHKIDTLLAALHRFRAALEAEAQLAAQRELRAGAGRLSTPTIRPGPR